MFIGKHFAGAGGLIGCRARTFPDALRDATKYCSPGGKPFPLEPRCHNAGCRESAELFGWPGRQPHDCVIVAEFRKAEVLLRHRRKKNVPS